MNPGDQIEAQLFDLATRDRARLARMLLASLEPFEDESVDQIWVEESERRLKAWRQGEVVPVEARQVFQEARQALQ